MIYDLNALYRAAKSEAKHRDEVYSRFLSGSHPDAERIFNFHNSVVRDLVRDYAANGGKRDLSGLIAEDKGDS